jgi:GNAT superfamily N-acetyltransferase
MSDGDGTSRIPIDRGQLEIRAPLSEDVETLRSFSCGDDSEDEDLNDFLRADALRLQDQKVALTFLALYADALVGYVTLLADSVVLLTKERKKVNLTSSDHPVVPALKIARLASSLAFRTKHRGIGEALVAFAYARALGVAALVGCRFLTLDARPSAVPFYNKLGFVPNMDKSYLEREEKTRHLSMRFDLFAKTLPDWINVAGEDPPN